MPIACRFAFAAAKKASFENVGLRNSAENVRSAANEECLDRFQKKPVMALKLTTVLLQ